MAIANTDLRLHTSVNHPVNDTDATGGTIDVTRRPEFTQFAAPAQVAIVSDGVDARVATVVFRNLAGGLVTEVLNLTGATEVLTVATAERLLSVTLDSSSPARIVSVKEGAGGTVRGTIPINEIGFTASFISSASEVGAVNRNEKLFWLNGHGSLTLNTAEVTLTADPSARIKIGLEAAKNGSSSIGNRRAVPGSVTFVDDNVVISVPTGFLAAGDRIGMWVQQGLLASDVPFKSNFQTRLSGVSS